MWPRGRVRVTCRQLARYDITRTAQAISEPAGTSGLLASARVLTGAGSRSALEPRDAEEECFFTAVSYGRLVGGQPLRAYGLAVCRIDPDPRDARVVGDVRGWHRVCIRWVVESQKEREARQVTELRVRTQFIQLHESFPSEVTTKLPHVGGSLTPAVRRAELPDTIQFHAGDVRSIESLTSAAVAVTPPTRNVHAGMGVVSRVVVPRSKPGNREAMKPSGESTGMGPIQCREISTPAVVSGSQMEINCSRRFWGWEAAAGSVGALAGPRQLRSGARVRRERKARGEGMPGAA